MSIDERINLTLANLSSDATLSSGNLKASSWLDRKALPTYRDMPISKNEFDKGRREDPMIDKIQEFLESNKDKAFTEDEILRRLYPDHTAWPGDRIGFHSAVLILSYAGKIDTRFVTTPTTGVDLYFTAK